MDCPFKTENRTTMCCIQSLSLVQLFCDPVDCSLPGSPVHGISQVRILEWIAIPFSRGSFQIGIKLMSPALTGGFFTTEPPETPRTTV